RPLIAPKRQAGADGGQGEGPAPAARSVGIDDDRPPSRRLRRLGVPRQVGAKTAAAVEQQDGRARPVVVWPDDLDVGLKLGPAGGDGVHTRNLGRRFFQERGLASLSLRYICLHVRYI